MTGEDQSVLSRHDYLPFGEEIGAALGNRDQASGLTGYTASRTDGPAQKFTGKERDDESQLDYFGARYFSGAGGRFTSADAPFADQGAADPQSWNLYAYTRNNPLKYVDRTGDFIETAWDAVNIGIGVASFVHNVKQGNYGWAAVDAVGVVVDLAATAIPGAPGGAGTVIRASRAAGGVARAVNRADNAVGAAKGAGKAVDSPRGGTYKLVDPNTGQVRRTGTTNDLKRRKSEHSRGKDTKDLEFEIDKRSDDPVARRGREQIIYDEHPGADLNKRRPISPKNPRRNKYLEAGRRLGQND